MKKVRGGCRSITGTPQHAIVHYQSRAYKCEILLRGTDERDLAERFRCRILAKSPSGRTTWRTLRRHLHLFLHNIALQGVKVEPRSQLRAILWAQPCNLDVKRRLQLLCLGGQTRSYPRIFCKREVPSDGLDPRARQVVGHDRAHPTKVICNHDWAAEMAVYYILCAPRTLGHGFRDAGPDPSALLSLIRPWLLPWLDDELYLDMSRHC
jgi:hypothetical protein